MESLLPPAIEWDELPMFDRMESLRSPVNSFLLRVALLAREWWSCAVSTSYRTSKFSRRPSWHFTIPGYFCLNLLSDVGMGADPCYAIMDVLVMGIILLATSRMPIHSWRPDIMMVVAVESLYVCSVNLTIAGKFYPSGTTPLAFCMFSLLVLHLFGVNTLMIYLASLVTGLITMWVVPHQLDMVFLFILIFLPWMVFIDTNASLAHLAHTCVHKLLDDCSDGFLSIDLDTEQISSTSDKLEGLLGGSIRVPFADFVITEDLPRFDHLLDQARDGRFEATFLSCRAPSPGVVTQFDCKIIPYMKCLNQLHVCLQMMGEARIVSVGWPSTADGLNMDEDARGPLRPHEPGGAPKEGGVEDPADHRLATGPPGSDAGDGFGSEITFDLTSMAPPPSNRALSMYTYSASYVTARREVALQHDYTQTISAKTVDVATQTSSLPPLPSSPSGEPPGRAAPACARYCSRRRRTVNVRLCSSQRFLPQFAATPDTYMGFQLLELFPHYNTTGSGCCKFHIIATRFQSVIRQIVNEACRPDFKPHSSWQCAICLAMNSDDASDEDAELVCSICCAEDAVLHASAVTESSGHDERASAAGTLGGRSSE